MGHIQFNTPFTKAFTHSNATINASVVQILAPTTNPYDKRVMLLIQNQHSTAVVDVILNAAGTTGIKLYPMQSLTLENYNGIVRAVSNTTSTPVHIAYSLV